PLVLQPRLERVFLSVWRTVSRAMLSTTSNSTNLSASRRRVQRCCPVGGSLQATAIKCASCAPSSLRRYWRRGARRWRAAVTPSSTHRWRTLATEVGCTAKAVLISSSVQPGPAGLLSAWSSAWAWVRVRAAIFPLRTSASNCSRSSGLKVTTYFFMLGVLRGLVTAMFPKNTQRLLTLKITPDEVLVLAWTTTTFLSQ